MGTVVRWIQSLPGATQLPAEQTCGDWQAGLAPQVQAPEEEHVSDSTPHATQAAPAAPQFEAVRVRQVPPAQQPLLQLTASQTQLPPTHRWPEPHDDEAPHMQTPFTQAFAV
jgi:hypothetical protein